MGTTGGPHGSVGGARAPHAMSAEYESSGYDISGRSGTFLGGTPCRTGTGEDEEAL